MSGRDALHLAAMAGAVAAFVVYVVALLRRPTWVRLLNGSGLLFTGLALAQLAVLVAEVRPALVLPAELGAVMLLLAVAVQERNLRTIEGITGDDGGLHPMQQAFIDHDAFQCGYCTPGQIMSAISCVEEGHAESPLAIQEFMSGNLCRCAAYPNIVAAIGQARQRMGP